jgi:Lon protease-like protein
LRDRRIPVILGNLGEVTSASRAAREEGSPVGCCAEATHAKMRGAAMIARRAAGRIERLGLWIIRPDNPAEVL